MMTITDNDYISKRITNIGLVEKSPKRDLVSSLFTIMINSIFQHEYENAEFIPMLTYCYIFSSSPLRIQTYAYLLQNKSLFSPLIDVLHDVHFSSGLGDDKSLNFYLGIVRITFIFIKINTKQDGLL